MLSLTPVKIHESKWDPDTAQVTLNARLDARLVPQGSAMRLDYSHVVVLDNFFGETERQPLLDLLTQPGWDHSEGPPTDKWERETADGAGLPKTWGLKDSILCQLATSQLPAMQEIHTRLAKLYSNYTIAHMPSDMIQHSDEESPAKQVEPNSSCTGTSATQDSDSKSGYADITHLQSDAVQHASQRPANAGMKKSPAAANDSMDQHDDVSSVQQTAPVDCNQFVGNAAVYGDCYSWHVDADPAAFPASPWVDTFGYYCNGDPGRPLQIAFQLEISSCTACHIKQCAHWVSFEACMPSCWHVVNACMPAIGYGPL